MLKFPKTLTATLIPLALSSLLLTNCSRDDQKKSALKQIASSANHELIGKLEAGEKLKLSEVLENSRQYGLSDKEVRLLKQNLDGLQIDRLVLDYLDPNGLKGLEAPRWVWVPDTEDDASMATIEAISKDDQIDVINGKENPELVAYPIITISYDESLPVQSQTALSYQNNQQASEGAMMLDSIRLENDHEPWIKGAAEIYLVVSYIDKTGKGFSEIMELPAVDHQKKDYYPRKLIHQWPKNKYQLVNVAVMEHDSGHNYAELTKAFVAAASGISTALIDPTLTTAVAVTGIVTTLANAVIDALPEKTFVDGDDFVDSLNSLEKYENATYSGTAGNATLRTRLYKLKLNDE